MNSDDDCNFEHLLTSAPASVALMGQTVLMTMMGTDASLLFNSYDGHVGADADGALKIFQWATAIRSDVVHLILCACKAIEIGEKYIDESIKTRSRNEDIAIYSKTIIEFHQLVQLALDQSSTHSDEILVQITSFLNRYPRKPNFGTTTTPSGSVYTTIELMRQAIVRSQKAYDQLKQSWLKYGRLYSRLLHVDASIDLSRSYLRISRDFITPAANSVRTLLDTVFDADSSKNENATAAVEKARDELMAAYNNACETIKGLGIS